LNETLHHFPRRFSKRIIASTEFSHSLDPERNSYSFLTQQKGHSGCLTANLSPRDA
jgi:hypothetical protein